MLRCVIVATLLTALLAAQTERQLLARELHDDPFVLLRAIGNCPDHDAATRAAEALRQQLAEQPALRLRLLRLGFGAEDDTVLFGAVVLQGPEFLPVPELRHAAEVVVRAFGTPGCPVEFDELIKLEGSRDLPTAIARLPELPAELALRWLDELHRLSRPEHVPLYLALARQTRGDLRNTAFSNACMTSEYSGQYRSEVVAAWLQFVGGKPDADGVGLPGVLTAALRWQLEHRDDEDRQQDQAGDERRLVAPWLICLRWLLDAHAAAGDLPLLQRCMADDDPFLQESALLRLGDLRDAASLAVLQRFAADARGEFQAPALAALSRRGDVAAKARLGDGLDGTGLGTRTWLSVATPTECADWCRRLLARPPAEAVAALRELQGIVDDRTVPPEPEFEDVWLEAFEPLAATTAVDARVLRSLVAIVPGCATQRLAEQLLAMPVEQLLAPLPDDDDAIPGGSLHGDVGFAGVWPFLEVTCRAALCARLREGLACADAKVKEAAAMLLLRLGDEAAGTALLTWMQTEPDCLGELDKPWLLLARCRPTALQAVLLGRLRDADGEDSWDDDAVQALACLLGMPFEAAAEFAAAVEADRQGEVLGWLRQGKPLQALLAAHEDHDLTAVEDLLPLCSWPDADVQAWLRPKLEAAAASSAEAWLSLGIARGDAEVIGSAREMILDGRYATHHVFPGDVLTLGRSTELLPFWIGEYCTNCCRRSTASEALTQLCQRDGDYYEQETKPTGVRLQQRLLPRLGQLRWSRLAGCFVVAGK